MNPNYASNMSHHHIGKGYESLPGPSSQQPRPPFPPISGNMLPPIGSMVPPPGQQYNMASAQAQFNIPASQNQVNFTPPPAHINYGQPPAQVSYSHPSTQVTYSPPMSQGNYSPPPPSNQVKYSPPPTQVNMPSDPTQVNVASPSTAQVNMPMASSAPQATVSSPQSGVNVSPPPTQVNVSPPPTQINVSPPHPDNVPVSPVPVQITQASDAATTSEISPHQSPNKTPPRETLPNPNQTLAGKLSENVRRSKRSKPMDTSEIKATLIAKLAKGSKTTNVRGADMAPDSTVEEDSDCPKEYLNDNAYTDRLRFNNAVAKVVYKEDFARLSTKEEFQKYLSVQQKWRWEIHNIVKTLDTRVNNLVANKNCGIAQNVMRYSAVPINCKSDDVRRCEKTAKELEKMGVRIAETKADIAMRKKLLFDDTYVDPAQGELDFLDSMISKIILLEENVDTCLSKVQDTLQSICRRFTTESVEAAEERRLKRRRKENIKKKRKSMERQLEKKLIDVLLRLTNKEVAERVLTTNAASKVSPAEINETVLQQMSADTEMAALETILSRNYLDEVATKMIKRKVETQ